MADSDASQIERVESAAAVCRSVLSLYGYARIDTPIVEETELFLRKSGGELSSRLYDFVEPGGFRSSLRPEFTSPVIRYAIENGDAGTRTCRYQYFGPVFRYATPEHPDGAKTRQFNQLGAELIGPSGPVADGEIMSVAREALKALGVESPVIALGHVGLLRQLLNKFDLSERSSQFLLARARSIASGELERIRTDAHRLGLVGDENRSDAAEPGNLDQIMQVLDRSLGELGANAGSRTRTEIIARLARKQTYTDDAGRFESALSMLGELMSITGTPASAIGDGRKLAVASNLDEGCFTLLEGVVEAASLQGVDEDAISISYGLARGVAYYTGMVFDILPSAGARETLGGGGRYDGLTRALGLDDDVPALGFAFYMENVLKLIEPSTADSSDLRPVLVTPESDASAAAAARAAAQLRAEGKPAVLGTTDEADSSRFADQIVVDAKGQQTRTNPGGAR